MKAEITKERIADPSSGLYFNIENYVDETGRLHSKITPGFDVGFSQTGHVAFFPRKIDSPADMNAGTHIQVR